MALLKMDEIRKMNAKERVEKINELKLELIKSGIKSHKASQKTKEIKKALARLLTTHTESRSGGKK